MNRVCWSSDLGIFVGCNSFAFSKDGLNWNLIDNEFLKPTRITNCSNITPTLIQCDDTSNLQINMFFLNRWITEINSENTFTLNDSIDISNGSILNENINYQHISYNNQLKCFLTMGRNRYNFSFDGINWSKNRTIVGRRNILIFDYSPQLGIYCGCILEPANQHGVLISSLKGRLPTSYNVFDSSFNNIDNNGNWTIRAKEIYNPGNLLLDVKGNLDLSGNISSPTSGAFSNLYLQFNMNGNTYKIPLNFN
jgi:hypothetical protein